MMLRVQVYAKTRTRMINIISNARGNTHSMKIKTASLLSFNTYPQKEHPVNVTTP